MLAARLSAVALIDRHCNYICQSLSYDLHY